MLGAFYPRLVERAGCLCGCCMTMYVSFIQEIVIPPHDCLFNILSCLWIARFSIFPEGNESLFHVTCIMYDT